MTLRLKSIAPQTELKATRITKALHVMAPVLMALRQQTVEAHVTWHFPVV